MGVSIPIGFSSSLQPYPLPGVPAVLDLFQSLSGFQVRCNALENVTGQVVGYQFQSLSGFQVRCNSRPGSWFGGTTNPVSIPIGFSSSLQLAKAGGQQIASCKFQSLSGFQVRCNGSSISGARSAEVFQSLSGFQVRCNTIGYPP